MKTPSLIIPLIALAMASGVVSAQTDSLGRKRLGVLLLGSSDPGVWSLLDGRVLGSGSLRFDSLVPGRHIVRSIPRSLTAWGMPESADTIDTQPGDTVRLTYPRKGFYLLESIPTGARVVLGDSLLGTTPILMPSAPQPGSGLLFLERDGFRRTSPGDHDLEGSVLKIVLEPVFDGHPPVRGLAPSRFSSAGAVVTGTGAIIAGIASAWLKTKADAKSEEYLAGRNPALRGQIDRLDAWGAVSLIVCQGLLVFLAFQLLAE
jgi:hypothetical protein